MSFAPFSVPGKLMLAGEYAVLQPGGVALACATGALVQVRPGQGGAPRLFAFERWHDVGPGATGLAQMAWRAAEEAQRRWQLPLGGAIELRVAGQIGGRKVGLGTSAAVTVAMLRGLLAALGQRRDDAEIAEAARAAHASGQGGGSGYDVTAIAHGGVVCYRRSPDRAAPLAWPADLAIAALFTGEPAPTADALARRAQLAPFLPQIHAAAEQLVAVWPGADRQAILAALGDCEQVAEAAAEAAPGLMTAAVWRAKAHCAAHQLVARTSGAGGGDCVLAAGAPAAVAAAVAGWRAGGDAVVAVLPGDLAPATAPLAQGDLDHEL